MKTELLAKVRMSPRLAGSVPPIAQRLAAV
jgi:hypothetical protein